MSQYSCHEVLSDQISQHDLATMHCLAAFKKYTHNCPIVSCNGVLKELQKVDHLIRKIDIL